MSLQRHLVVFARAPRLGAGKRRLARDIGDLAAWRFQRWTTAGLLRRLARDRRWVTWLAVTPDRALWRPGALWSQPRRLIAQGPGDLGQRMAHVLRLLPPGPVVIVGSDVPGIRARHVAEAFRHLGAHDWVLGPADDGGYWLIGARRRPVLRPPFDGVAWSGPQAMAQTRANMKGAKLALLEQLTDVDTGDDLAALSKTSQFRRW